MELKQTLKQQQVLSTQMIQTLALLPLSVVELKEYVQKEIESNPALEIPQDTTESFSEPQENENDDYPDYDSDSRASDRKMAAMENSAIETETLSEHLLKQLSDSPASGRLYNICQLLIGNLDANGFHIVPVKELFEDKDYSEEEINLALETVQSFDPYGICVKDFRESLVVQAKCSGMHESDLRKFSDLVYSCLEMMQNGKTREVAAFMGVSAEELEAFWAILKSYRPYPGRSYSTEGEHYVVPEFSVHVKEGVLSVEMNRSSFPTVEISEEFADLSKQVKGPEAKEASAYISESLKKARALVDQLEMRFKTMYNAAMAITDYQKDFFFNGPKYLKTLTLKTVAETIGVHETTVSRLTQNKYVDTDWGLLPMKYFFSQGVTSSQDGESISRNAVKEMIAEILKEHPGLSDQKVSDALLAKGIKCARRTVNKYRSEMI